MITAQALAAMPAAERERVIRGLSPADVARLKYAWRFWARASQLAPDGDAWIVWLILAGRAMGKTRAGAEWVIERVNAGSRHLALIGRTIRDVRETMIRGESGILALSPPWNMPVYVPSLGRLRWPNGAEALTFTAEKPDQLRGPQPDTVWADELAAWNYPAMWTQVTFAMRSIESGLKPRACVTTTPRPTKLVRELMADTSTVVTRGSTFENAANLDPAFIAKLKRQYEGTRIGRQELYGAVLEDAPGALWKRDRIHSLRVAEAPELRAIVVAVDPAVTSGEFSNETGIIVAGVGVDGHGYVLED
ncbi:MAG: terminase family protein, partial [Polyangiaceae bacterium]